ncbi:hypothetical protein [Desulfurivibrio dismutans]|uniref:hypothetical protein n=1 Tax=Desulfurivibrio dismutans TaxID=1398908 RepID=UPI0023DA7DAA|nr:hypothetical protein [Desulfurivibrio alkaliphilus]MDF1614698.1 hypothetical protein [Desulfurivibrio alkaliphilus]
MYVDKLLPHKFLMTLVSAALMVALAACSSSSSSSKKDGDDNGTGDTAYDNLTDAEMKAVRLAEDFFWIAEQMDAVPGGIAAIVGGVMENEEVTATPQTFSEGGLSVTISQVEGVIDAYLSFNNFAADDGVTVVSGSVDVVAEVDGTFGDDPKEIEFTFSQVRLDFDDGDSFTVTLNGTVDHVRESDTKFSNTVDITVGYAGDDYHTNTTVAVEDLGNNVEAKTVSGTYNDPVNFGAVTVSTPQAIHDGPGGAEQGMIRFVFSGGYIEATFANADLTLSGSYDNVSGHIVTIEDY